MINIPTMHSSEFAVVYTVRNEWDLLRYAIPFYLAKGAKRIYIYLDGTTDETPEGAKAFEQVYARGNVTLAEIATTADWMRDLDPERKMDHRKRLNAMHAANLAARDGIEWICCIDPDEIILPDETETSLQEMLTSIGSEIDQVLVPNMELLPVKSGEKNLFKGQTVFLQRNEPALQAWRILAFFLKRLFNPRTLARLENYFFKLALRGKFPPTISNPVTGGKIYRSLFLGYTNCKSFMRSSRAEDFMFNVHKWQSAARSPKSVSRGRLLHYDLPSFEYFLRKFQQRDANMLIKAFDTRYQLALIARDASESVARNFYDSQLCSSDVEQLIKAGIAKRIDEVASFFTQTQPKVPTHHDAKPSIYSDHHR